VEDATRLKLRSESVFHDKEGTESTKICDMETSDKAQYRDSVFRDFVLGPWREGDP
jgi:hypothetical protein